MCSAFGSPWMALGCLADAVMRLRNRSASSRLRMAGFNLADVYITSSRLTHEFVSSKTKRFGRMLPESNNRSKIYAVVNPERKPPCPHAGRLLPKYRQHCRIIGTRRPTLTRKMKIPLRNRNRSSDGNKHALLLCELSERRIPCNQALGDRRGRP